MAFSGIIRRAASSVSLLVIRAAVGTQRSYHTVLFSSLKKNSTVSQELCRRTFTPTSLNFSSVTKMPSSDKSLLEIIDSEIKDAEESDDHNHVEEIPDGFPFEIQDNPGQQTISLRREYQGEIIKVEVHTPNLFTGDDGDENDEDEDDERSNQSSLALVISVSKGSGIRLEFGCTAYPDEITIDSLSVKDPEASEDQIAYEGPDFEDLDENLQTAFHKYLEIRGIKPSTTNFLHEFMISKDSREYLMWLKNLKKFIEQ